MKMRRKTRYKSVATAAAAVAGWDDDGWFNECQVGHIVSEKRASFNYYAIKSGSSWYFAQ